MKKIIIKTIIWIFAIIICICVTLYSCREIVTPNYEVVGGSMQKINIKGIELPNKNHGNYYLIVVKLKGANKRKQLFGFKCYLDGITSAINKIRITDDKSELLSDSIRGLDQINRIPYDLLTVEYKDVYKFYDKMREDYITSTGDPYGIFDGDPTLANRKKVEQFIKLPEEYYEEGDKD